MRTVDLIIKKRMGQALSKEEINFLIEGYTNDSIPDYQISALLMAICFQGLNADEQAHMAEAMLKSGDQIDLSKINGVKADKHSTGGVGDKTTLVVAPIVASLGIKLAKMSGRGLGHTGGTLDKLESIPGFRIEVSQEDFVKQVNDIGLALIGQSANITPADKKLYALRDVTGTVESIGLIATSIMSKKLASGADHIVLDVKVGRGAFMKDLENAQALAKAMVSIGTSHKRDTVCVLTSMEQPLGNAVGNRLEVIEAIETLKGNGPADFNELCRELSAEILLVSKVVKEKEEALSLVDKVIKDGSALEKFRQMVQYQGGNPDVVRNYSMMKEAKEKIDVKSPTSGYVSHIDAQAIGEASMIIGGGRLTKAYQIDHSVGILLNKKVGDRVMEGETLATIITNGKNTEECYQKIINAYEFSKDEVKVSPIVLDIIK